MIKIGITGSLASGKSTVVTLMSKNKYPIFSADKEVHKLYKEQKIVKRLKTIFKITSNSNSNIKKKIKGAIGFSHKNLRKLEIFLHPQVRKRMKSFIKKKENKKILLLEIPLLFESKLQKEFDVIIFVNANKKIRVKRFKKRGGKGELFTILDKRQNKASVKIKLSNHTIHNNTSLKNLKKNVTVLINKYE